MGISTRRNDSGTAALGEQRTTAPAPGALQSADWRELTADSGPEHPTELRRRPAADRLHLHVRPAPWRDERARAASIVREGKAAVDEAFASIRRGGKMDVAKLSPIVDGIMASVSRNPIALPSITRLKTRHEYTYLHSISVCGLMIGLSDALGLDPALRHDIGMAGLLHDVGKARVPTVLLDKPAALTSAEFRVMQAHTERGLELLVQTGGVPEIALDVCLHHHERIDGSGYPHGLGGDSLSIYARMGAVCDVYDAVTSIRAYKNAWPPSQALEFMTGATGHFDQRILAAFTAMIGVFPVGALVRLESGRLAIVLDETDADPFDPPVAVFHCAMTRRPVDWRRIAPGSDPIIGIERPERWAFADWNGLRAEVLARFAG